MGRDKNAHSHIRRVHGGCLTGCFTRILMLFGLAAFLFVGACAFGLISNDADGRPTLDLSALHLENISLPTASSGSGSGNAGSSALLSVWPYAINGSGLTLKVLRCGEGQAVLVCCDGYTMLVGGGSSTYETGAQMLLCGVNRLDAAIALSSEEKQTKGMIFAAQLAKPSWVFYGNTQTVSAALSDFLRSCGTAQQIVPSVGMSFNLGRARVSFIGPVYTNHTDSRDDALSLRIDCGNTGILILGELSSDGQRELLDGNMLSHADALIYGGTSEEEMPADAAAAIQPSIVLCTEDADWKTKARLEQLGAKVYAKQQYGVMTLYSDGETIQVYP